MLTISGLYKDDLPGCDPIFVMEYPLTFKQDEIGDRLPTDADRFLVNRSQYPLDDEFRERDYESNRIEKPHRNLPVLGQSARAYVDRRPSSPLVAHWRRQLGEDAAPRYGDLGEQGTPHVLLYPLECLPRELHAIDPDIHFRVYSKPFIGEIDCPQADILSDLDLPSVLKVARSSGGHGTWMIRSVEDYHNKMSVISETMPHAETVLTRMVENVESNFCCHVYVNRVGEMRWIGTTEKLLDEHCVWIGACFEIDLQADLEQRLRSTCQPVVDALHRSGYFGLVGIDVLVDIDGRHYVIDINPRILGSTPLLLSALALHETRGWKASMFLTHFIVHDENIEAFIDRVHDVKDGDVIVYSNVRHDLREVNGERESVREGRGEEDEDGEAIKCQIGIFSASLEACRVISKNLSQQ